MENNFPPNAKKEDSRRLFFYLGTKCIKNACLFLLSFRSLADKYPPGFPNKKRYDTKEIGAGSHHHQTKQERERCTEAGKEVCERRAQEPAAAPVTTGAVAAASISSDVSEQEADAWAAYAAQYEDDGDDNEEGDEDDYDDYDEERDIEDALGLGTY